MIVDLVTLAPAMTPGGPAEADAVWVGLLDEEALVGASDRLALAGATTHARARLLVRRGGAVRGYATLPIEHGTLGTDAVRAAVARLDPPQPTGPASARPVSVVICTRDRAEQLREALRSVLRLEGEIEVVVVDDAPTTDAARRVVDELADPRVRYVLEPAPGLSAARNAGLHAASHDLVAFTDDDVVVDALWATTLASAFAADRDAAVVSGLVPSGELRNDVQRWFDARVHWSKVLTRRVFRLAEPPADLPMFPFSVGEFGTGANFAVRRDLALLLGGFDEALGVGTRTRGGEDLDFFVRALVSGAALVVEPSAIVWHRHRDDLPGLRRQAIGYGTGFGAWATKVALHPATALRVARRAPRALVRLLAARPSAVDGDGPVELGRATRGVRALELRHVLVGPWALLVERMRRGGWRG